MTRPEPISPFKTLEEEAEYWNTHSVADNWDESKMVNLIYEPEPKKAVIHVKVAENLKKKIEWVAKSKDISVSSLIRMWTVEKLKQLPAG